MNNLLFSGEFTLQNTPHWPCPSCEQGILKIEKEKFHSYRNAETINYQDEESFEYDWVSLVFNGIMKCNLCPETVVFSGIGHIEQDHPNWPEYHGATYDEVFEPKFFYPAIPIIKPINSDSIPKETIKLIKKSFELYWCDPSACVNKLRSSIEALLDFYGVKRKEQTKSGKIRPLTLHERIEELKALKGSKHSILLSAIKWLGNSGSHTINGIQHQNALDAYQIIELYLNENFPKPNNTQEIYKLAEEIDTNKGPVLE